MMRKWCRVVGCLGSVIFLLLLTAPPITGQRTVQSGKWRTYGADLASTRYSALDQINASNFNKLVVEPAN